MCSCPRLPLYEGVDWNFVDFSIIMQALCVSLFTREWIEIATLAGVDNSSTVSLFTREWIEIGYTGNLSDFSWRLPLYEGVDWNVHRPQYYHMCCSLPLYEGVDWNACPDKFRLSCPKSPSLRGSGLKSLRMLWIISTPIVSLFTREWIEITNCCFIIHLIQSLPLYEGVDWNDYESDGTGSYQCLPLYEGVDWNPLTSDLYLLQVVSLFTREWIEITPSNTCLWQIGRLPLYEGVDWNICVKKHQFAAFCLPLYEGVDWNQSHCCYNPRIVASPSLRGSGLK